MLTFLSRIFNGNLPGRIPVLVVSLGLGVLLITGGAAMRVQQVQAVEVAMAATHTALAPTATLPYTATATETPAPTGTPTITLTPSNTPTGTLPPTDTPAPTDTPSPTPVPASGVNVMVPTAPPEGTPLEGIPVQMPAIGVPAGVENIMLLGSDLRPDLHEGYLTDTIIVVSINKVEGTVNMLSIPRDLYVWAPNWGIAKINTVYGRGQSVGYDGGGPGLLRDTLYYNFGITIHHYALVDLRNFRDIVDLVGGVDIPVDCNLIGYQLKRPILSPDDFGTEQAYVDYTDPESGNWEVYSMLIGVHHMDGHDALWYSRFRKAGTDFERSTRQQQVLRAILRTARDQGFLNATKIPQLWNEYNELVETDMGMGNMLQLLPIASDIDTNEIGSYNVADMLINYTPAEGTFVGIPGYLLDPAQLEAIRNRVASAMGPPTQTLLNRQVPVEIRNGTGHDGLDLIAAEQINGRGISVVTIPTGEETGTHNPNETVIIDYTGQQKSNQLLQMQRLLGVPEKNLISQPDPNRTVDYVIVLGEDYFNKVNQCLRQDPATKDNTGANEP